MEGVAEAMCSYMFISNTLFLLMLGYIQGMLYSKGFYIIIVVGII